MGIQAQGWQALLAICFMAEIIGIDHIYIAAACMARSERFYDLVLRDTLGFRKARFALCGDPHIQYFNRDFGFVIRPARDNRPHNAYAPGLHHLCFRVDSTQDVVAVEAALRSLGIEATAAECYPEYATDYWATYFDDPDGTRLEVTNYRRERRERHDNWQGPAA